MVAVEEDENAVSLAVVGAWDVQDRLGHDIPDSVRRHGQRLFELVDGAAALG